MARRPTAQGRSFKGVAAAPSDGDLEGAFMAWISLLLLALALSLASGRARGEEGWGADPAAPLVAEALEANPGLLALALRTQALEEAARGRRVVMDPMASVEYSNVPWRSPDLGSSMMSGVQLRLTQTLPRPAVNDQREAAAQARAEVAAWEEAEARVQLEAAVRRAFWQLAFVRGQGAILQRHLTELEGLLASMQARYAVGHGGQVPLLRTTLLRDRLQEQRADLGRDEAALLASLAGALHRPPGMALPTPALVAAAPLPAASLEDLLAAAEDRRPLLAHSRAEAEAHRRAARLVEAERWQGLSVSVGYRIRAPVGTDPGDDLVSLGIMAPIPLDLSGARDHQRQAALLEAEAAEARLSRDRDRLAADLEAELARWRRAADRARRYDAELRPLAEEARASALASFGQDRGDFEALYQSEALLLELEGSLLMARLETWTAHASVRALVGGEAR